MVMLLEKPQETNLILPDTEEKPWTNKEIKEMLLIQQMLQGPAGVSAVLGLYGKPGSGKTAFMTWLGYKLRKYFNMGTIVDSPFLKPAYGEYKLVLDDDFAREYNRIYKITRQYRREKRLSEFNWETIGSPFYRAFFGWDEGQSKIPARAAAKNKMSEAYLDFIAQFRHFQCVIAITTPSQTMIDRQKSYTWFTHDVTCSCGFYKDDNGNERVISKYVIQNRSTKATFVKNLDVMKWSKLFDSFAPITPRTNFLHFKGVEIEDDLEDEEYTHKRKKKN